MQNLDDNTPAWLSPEEQKNWRGRSEGHSDERPPLIPKPFESLPATPRSAPAVTNGLPDEV